MVEIITSHASISMVIVMLKMLLTKPIETIKSGLLWLLRVSPFQESSHLIEQSLSTAVKFGIFNQFQFLILQLTQIKELDLLPTWPNSTEYKNEVYLILTEIHGN
jgi:hypothetical protein